MTSKELAVISNKEPQQISTRQTLERVSQALLQLGASLSNVQDSEIAEALVTVRSFTGVMEAAEDVLKNRVLPLLKKDGTVATEKGTMRLNIGGWKLEAIPTRTGYDPKRLEALLRNRGIDPSVAMDSKVTYTVNEGKLRDVMESGAHEISEDEVELTRYQPNYRIIVKKVESDYE